MARIADPAPGRCPQFLSPRDRFDSFNPRRCGRPVVDGGTLCGLHSKAAARQAEKAAADREARAADERRHTQGAQRADALAALAGTPRGAQAHWQPSYGGGVGGAYTGGVVLRPEAADALLALLADRP